MRVSGSYRNIPYTSCLNCMLYSVYFALWWITQKALKLLSTIYLKWGSSGTAFVNGGWPVTKINNIIPNENISAPVPLYSFFSNTSGAIYDRVPHASFSYPIPFYLLFIANPKSTIFKFKCLSINIFSGFRSKWTNPFICIYETPFKTYLNKYRASYSPSFPFTTRSNKSPYYKYSRTMQLMYIFFPLYSIYLPFST